MTDILGCPRCGAPRPAGSPVGLCPPCLIQQTDADSDPGAGQSLTEPPRRGVELSESLEPASSSAMARIGETIGGVPHVLLRDTEIENGPGPILKPSSPEMPEPSERREKYQIFGEIARGGMGAVLKGRDVDLGRDLAVKVLLESHLETPDMVRRFVEEAQINGQLQHPGVVPVYELGTFADRRPYFTMKLVKGRTLAELLRARTRRGSSDPAGPASEGLPPALDDLPRFLSIFESVVQTMAYAHVRGVIHRDLKPSNIMVGSFGEVQVMDWGLAKVLPQGGAVADEPQRRPHSEIPVSVIQTARSGSDADASSAGSVLGTPGYMSPEQARGEIEGIDERADVFGLGAILCEILTGEPAFVGRSVGETIRKAGRGELAEAFARLGACGAEHELVALAKDCLAPEREDRPRQAGQVCERITAYLTGVQERLRKADLARAEAQAHAEEERKRRKLALALAAAVMALVTVGGAGVAIYFQQRRAQANRLELALRDVHLLRDQARADPEGDPAKWHSALEAVKRAQDLLGPLIDATSHREATELAEQVAAAAQAADREAVLLRTAVDIRAATAEDPSGSISDAAYTRAFREAGLDVDALGLDPAGAKIRARPAGVALPLAAVLDYWALSRRRARPSDTDGWKRLIAAARAADPDATRDRLRELMSEPKRKAQGETLLKLAKEADPERWPASSLTLLASAVFAVGEPGAAVELLRRAQVRHPADVWINYDLAVYLEKLQPPQQDEAIRFYSVARCLRPQTAHVLAHALARRGRLDEADMLFKDLARLRPADGGNLICWVNLLRMRGDFAAASATLEKAQAAVSAEVRKNPDSAVAHGTLGQLLQGQGKWSEAIAEYRAAIRINPKELMYHNGLGAILCDVKHDYVAAEAEFRAAIRLEPDDPTALCCLGEALRNQGKIEGALAQYGAALKLLPDDPITRYDRGLALFVQGKLDEAMADYRAAIRLAPGFAHTHYDLGQVLLLKQQGQVREALAELRRGHELGSKVPDWTYPSAEWVRRAERMVALEGRLAAVLRDDDKPKDAAESLGFADLAYNARRFGPSARWYAEAFQAEPKLAEDMNMLNRYCAASAAVLSAAGKAADQPPQGETAKVVGRKQAIDWLMADLAHWIKQGESGTQEAKGLVSQTLQRWKADPSLAAIRDESAVRGLPDEEQKACRALWAEVENSLKKTMP